MLNHGLLFDNLHLLRTKTEETYAIEYYPQHRPLGLDHNPSVTRHHIASEIALFDVLDMLWGCALPINASLPQIIPVSCSLKMSGYGGGSPQSTLPLEALNIAFEPQVKTMHQAQWKNLQGYRFDYNDRDFQSLLEEGGEERLVSAVELKSVFHSQQMKGLQTLTFEVMHPVGSLSRPRLFLASLKLRQYTITGWAYGLGDVRRDSKSIV